MEIQNAWTEEECEVYINQFEEHFYDFKKHSDLPSAFGYGDTQFKSRGLGRKDYQVFIPFVLRDKFEEIQDTVYKALSIYKENVSSLAEDNLISYYSKLQKTKCGDAGYSVWHKEQTSGSACNRALAWMIYLNDVDNGGETEFLYQQTKFSPKAGNLLMWPAGYTHPHRGNPPYSNDKYVLTGWFYYPSEVESELFKEAYS